MSVSKLASKLNVSKIITKSSKSYQDSHTSKIIYPSVTKILTLLSEGKFSEWNQSLVLDSFINQIVYLQKRQPNRVISKDDLNFLRKASESAPKEELRKKADEGAQTHALLSNLIKGKEIKRNPKYDSFLAGYRLWKKTNQIDIYFTDVYVTSDKYKYSGFIDAVGMNQEGNVVVIDFKSGKGIYDSYALQLAAYCKALEECCDCQESIKDAYILHIHPEDANFDFLKVDNLDHAFDLFLHCKELYTIQNKMLFVQTIYMEEYEEKEDEIYLFQNRNVSFYSLFRTWENVIDLILYMSQQYPCFPLDLKKSISTIYKSNREKMIAEKSLKLRDNVMASITILNNHTYPIHKLVFIIGSTVLLPQVVLQFFVSTSNHTSVLSNSDILSFKTALATSSVFMNKCLTSQKKVWLYICADRSLKSDKWIVDTRFQLPKKRNDLSSLDIICGNKEDIDETTTCWYKCATVIEGCPSI